MNSLKKKWLQLVFSVFVFQDCNYDYEAVFRSVGVKSDLTRSCRRIISVKIWVKFQKINVRMKFSIGNTCVHRRDKYIKIFRCSMKNFRISPDSRCKKSWNIPFYLCLIRLNSLMRWHTDTVYWGQYLRFFISLWSNK